jgi:hypothetical protein
MIIYNVTINIDAEVHDEWLKWMLEKHIPEVLATGLFVESRMSRMLIEEEGGGITYSIQYTLESMEKMDEYEEKHAPRLREDVLKRYEGKFGAFRTKMEVVGLLKP